MNNTINDFPDLPAVVTRIDLLVYEAKRTDSRKEKSAKLREAQRLADAYEAHAAAHGNDVKQFKQIYNG